MRPKRWMGRTEFQTWNDCERALVGCGGCSARAKWRAPRSARFSTLKRPWHRPTLLEMAIFNSSGQAGTLVIVGTASYPPQPAAERILCRKQFRFVKCNQYEGGVSNAWLLAFSVRQQPARLTPGDGDLRAIFWCLLPTLESDVATCCDGCPVSLQLSPDLHLALAKRWPGMSVGIVVPPRNIEGRFCTSARRFVRAVPSRRDHARNWKAQEKFKGCDIGYALVACSREGASSVDARTVTALWCDRCFRSPKF